MPQLPFPLGHGFKNGCKKEFIMRLLTSSLLLGSIAQPAFGCRLTAVMEPYKQTWQQPNVRQQSDVFVWTTLVSDKNSLKNESQPQLQVPVEYNGYEELFGVGRYGQKDGWGIAGYQPDAIRNFQQPAYIVKSPKPAFADTRFDQVIQSVLPANLVLAHIRSASDECKEVQLANVHPFSYQNWSFIHNGTVSGAFSPTIESKIQQYRQILAGGPKGNTDSERVFYYFLSKLYETTGTTNSSTLPLNVVQTNFAQAINDLMTHSKYAYKPLTGSLMGIRGDIQFQPSCNFILSDGSHLFAFKKGFDLFLGEKTLSNAQKIYVLSSERTHLGDPSVKWLEIPEEHIVTISWDASGNPVPEIEPLSRFLKQNPSNQLSRSFGSKL
jgi:predicted glutamine amidotransferase